jgi:DNA-binding transcriptional ArsR family regulator
MAPIKDTSSGRKRDPVARKADKKTSGAKNSRKAKSAGKLRPTTTRRGRDARTEEQRVSHIVNHPVRLDALVIFSERMASPNELVKLLGVPLATASHHVLELLNADVIELVKIEPRRGAIEHFYRAKVRPEVTDEEWKQMPKGTKRRLAANFLTTIVSESLASLRHGKMDDDDDLYIFWMPVRSSDEGRGEFHEIFAEFHERIEAVREMEETRQVENDAPARFVAMMHFERSRPGMPDGNALGRVEN